MWRRLAFVSLLLVAACAPVRGGTHSRAAPMVRGARSGDECSGSSWTSRPAGRRTFSSTSSPHPSTRRRPNTWPALNGAASILEYEIEHDGTYTLRVRRGQSHYYAHLERQKVTTGTRVRAGDIVGYVGNSGNARTTPPHLHFGIYQRGEGPIDPLPFVRGARGPEISVD